MAQKRDMEKERRWRAEVREFLESGISARQYCLAKNISVSSLHWWRREIRRRDDEEYSDPAFAEVHVVDENNSDVDSNISIIIHDAREIQVRRGFDGTTLLRVIELLEGSRC